MSESYDIIVVGAGIAGASAAARLAADARVLLLEREEQPGYHSTGRSAAMYIVNYGPPDVRALSIAGREFFLGPPEGFADTPLVSPRGVLMLAHPGQEAILDKELAASVGMEAISPETARELVPLLRPEAVAAAGYESDAQDIDVAALHQGFLRLFRARGGQMQLRAPLDSAKRKSGVWEVTTPAGTFEAPILINAAGAWADLTAEAAGVRPLGIQPKRRTALIIDGAPGEPGSARWPLMADCGETWYCRPEATRKLLVSPADATPTEPCDARPEELDVALAVDRFQQAVDLPVQRIEHSWAGLRSFSPDGSLVIGFDAEAEGFFWMAGQGGYGIQTSPGASALAAALVRKESLPSYLTAAGVDPQALSPARFRR
ncbi:NAD(P)/FAD-dependent oxidoreductase [Aquibaculum arenosum]|uniref:FAD-binding oxidoreductase n=1 Tax=Aquibaculum arenosum TaxID=3032591 RepID=A0ABT5YMT5_9PROT|nr:FAD-binding oxidoreductase [Fodinicurvata sp. CAU 1616]MDF2096244.1 FAD-binding oxidoreductase [Fodinicurvata sp. CAU 1616]